jgi:hypothetical protein
MWDEYAEGGRGICLCFETSDLPFSSVYDVNYVAELPTVKINADSGEQIEAFLLTKGSAYSWEHEWRFVDYNKAGGYKPISPWALRAVVLGSQSETSVKEEVIRLVTRWKPNVAIFVAELTGTDLRLQLLDRSLLSLTARIIPPIQEHLRVEPAGRPQSAQLLDYLRLALPEQRQSDLDGGIDILAARLARLEAVEATHGRRTKEVEADGVAVVREAIEFLRAIVDRSGRAIPGYGSVAVFLYRFVHAIVFKSDHPEALVELIETTPSYTSAD